MTATEPFNADEMVEEFNDTFGLPDDTGIWKTLVREEVDEAIEAATHLLKELADVMYTVTWALQVGATPDEVREVVGPTSELLSGLIDAFGEEAEEGAFIRVHQSNMSKLGDDGKPIRRDDGKVLKGPNYRAPDLSDLVDPSVRLRMN